MGGLEEVNRKVEKSPLSSFSAADGELRVHSLKLLKAEMFPSSNLELLMFFFAFYPSVFDHDGARQSKQKG